MKKRSRAKKKNKRLKLRAKVVKSVSVVKQDDMLADVEDVDKAVVEGGNASSVLAAAEGNLDDSKRLVLLESDDFVSLEQAREYWLLGEWEKLATFDLEFLRAHSKRAQFVLLVGSAYQQLGDMDKAREFTKLSVEWGATQSVVEEVLFASLCNVFGRFAALRGKKREALNYFEKSILCDFIPVACKSLHAELRMASQLRQLNIVTFLFYKKNNNKIVNFDFIDESQKKKTKQLVVLGMHRSGTSCVTGSFHNMGAYFASSKNIMLGNTYNPKGYFERMDAMLLNDQVLSKGHATWCEVSEFNLSNISTLDVESFKNKYKIILDELNKESLWIIKDPRFCLVYPLFEDLFDNPIFIHVYRNPVEVALSLNKRDGFPMSFGLALWEFYNKKALLHTKGMPKIQISYNDLIEGSSSIFSGLKKYFDNSFGIELNINEEDLSQSSFLDKSLYRNKVSELEMDEWLTTSQRVFWEMLEQGVFLNKDYYIPPLSKVCIETLKNYELYRKASSIH